MSDGSDGAEDFAVDTFIFEAAFGKEIIDDFVLDGVVLAAGITPDLVDTRVRGDNVVITVDVLDGQRIVVLDVADLFNPAIDISYGAERPVPRNPQRWRNFTA